MQSYGFLFQAFIYLAAAVAAVPFAKKLGLGSVMGYLLAGVIIGPFGFSLVEGEGSDVMHFAEFGVVMMLFLIGLGLRPKILWRLRMPLVGLGGLQVFLTSCAIMLVAYYLGLSWREAWVIGIILALSSTALVMQTLSEKKLEKTVFGRRTLATLLFQDIAVIPILAILPLFAIQAAVDTPLQPEAVFIDRFPAYLRPLLILGSVIIIVVMGKYIIRPLFKLIVKTGLKEMFVAGALLLIISAAILTASAGVSPALGTFIAGVVLADSEYRHELESNIDPFKGLLLGLFFISVGASIDFNVIASGIGETITAVLMLVMVKFLVLLALGRMFKLKLRDNIMFATFLAQGGEFAFVLFSFALQENVLSEQMTNFLVAVTVMSMLITPVLILLAEKFAGKHDKHSRRKESSVNDGKLDEHRIIIAGFGDFGGTAGRFLNVNGVSTTILDIDSERVELLRKLGIKAFYGDASKAELLEAASANNAKFLIIAINDPEKCMEITRMAQKKFPKLKIFARACGRIHAFELLEAGVDRVYLDVLDTSLRLGIDVLTELGRPKHQARRKAVIFRRHEENSIRKLWSLRHDHKAYINRARKHMDDLARLIKHDTCEPSDLGESDRSPKSPQKKA